jgi:hypothetical protein
LDISDFEFRSWIRRTLAFSGSPLRSETDTVKARNTILEEYIMSGSLDRRKFHELSAAALGGLVAGTMAGCGDNPQPQSGPSAAQPLETHLCRGLNDCKGQGASGTNDCRGQGDCATVAHHSCGGENACKGQGGCGETVAENACKGEGKCQVPLMSGAWKKVRRRKEDQWIKAGEQFGPPPEKEAS